MVEQLEAVIHLDTHVVVWLYAGAVGELTPKVKAKLESDSLSISPAVLLELDFLQEIRRITVGSGTILEALGAQIGLTVSSTSFATVVVEAGQLTWTRDPFDRLIVGHASADGAVLVTRDRTIRRQYKHAFWR